MSKSAFRFALIAAMAVSITSKGVSQTVIPEELVNGTLRNQMSYLEEKTRIYEDYRAIREDMFQKIKNNAIDSLTKANNRISGLVRLTDNLKDRIDSLNSSLKVTKEELKEMIRTKNSINVIGIKVDKTLYNNIMWIIVAGLVLILAIGFLALKRNLAITFKAKKELKELGEEFEAYRKKTRLDREKMSMDHFKEIQKLKGV